MSPTPDLTAILEELASGRIDAAEAARRIDALEAADSQPSRHPEPTPLDPDRVPSPEPASSESASSESARHQSASPEPAAEPEPTRPEPSNEELAGDAWSAATDRPQFTSFTQESFRPSEPADGSSEATEPQRPRRVNTGGVERLSVRAVGRRVRIIGETSVATLSADGPHVLRRNGAVLEVSSDGEIGASLDGFSILRAPRSLDDFRSLGLGKELFLRVNPNIVVDVEVTAGSLSTERVPHLGKVRVTAGGAKLLDVQEINDALVQAGSATIKGSIRTGRSRIRAESGSLNLQLADDSNVTVTGDAQLGKISWSGGHDGVGDEVVMGNGSAKLEVEVVMGHAQIRVGSDRVSEDA